MIFCGIYEETIYKDTNTGYTIFFFQSKDFRKALLKSLSENGEIDLNKCTDDEKDKIVRKFKNKGRIVCKGYTANHRIGEPLIIDGALIKDSKGGYIAVNSIKKYSNNAFVTKKYLTSNLFSGIGEKTAESIVDFTGADVFSFVDKEDAAKLLAENVKGISITKAEKFVKEVKNSSVQNEVFDYIYPFGGSLSNAIKMYNIFGSQALIALKLDPYRVGYLAGLSFSVCDSLGQNLGFSPYDEKRITSIIFNAFEYFMSSGNTRVEFFNFLNTVSYISKNSIYKTQLPAPLIAYVLSLSKNFEIEKEKDKIYIYKRRYWNLEFSIVSSLLKLKTDKTKDLINEEFISKIEKALNIKYSKAQKECFNFLNSSGVKIITGGPGTGKTTVINGIIKAYKKLHRGAEIVLCAPTGRAAQRITDSTGVDAFTIHKLLDIKPFGDDIVYKDQSNPITADLIIVDEVSMIDTELFAILLGAIKPTATVILSGDINQLPSVGAGNVLSDLLKSKVIESCMLKTVYRQKEDSIIIENAKRIQQKKNVLATSDDFCIEKFDDETKMNERAINLYLEIAKGSEEVQLLSLQRKGLNGIRNLNREIQDKINDSPNFIIFNATKFAENDKIMMIRNNYELGYYNGNIGIIKKVNEDCVVVEIMGEEIELTQDLYADMELAYAITTHKSQGSEFENVVITIPDGNINSLHNRNLVYTAITRAKKRVFILSENDALEKCIENENIINRETGLCQKIIKGFKKDKEFSPIVYSEANENKEE